MKIKNIETNEDGNKIIELEATEEEHEKLKNYINLLNSHEKEKVIEAVTNYSLNVSATILSPVELLKTIRTMLKEEIKEIEDTNE